MDDLIPYRKTENELIALYNTVDIFSKDIGTKFEISKCAKVIVHRVKFEQRADILASTSKITYVETDKAYKYLGVRQTNEKQKKFKTKQNKPTSKESNKYLSQN